MKVPETKKELRHLFSLLVDGVASKEDVEWFNVAMRQDQSVRCLYWEFIAAETDARNLTSDAPEASSIIDLQSVFDDAGHAGYQESDQRFSIGTILGWQEHPVRFLSLVTLVTVIAWIGLFFFLNPNNDHSVSDSLTAKGSAEFPHEKLSDKEYCGKLIRGSNASWSAEMGDMHAMTPLRLGKELQLQSGHCLIEFASGAKVALKGPSRLVITGENSANLIVGELTAKIGKQSTGFRVETPKSNIVDVGTEFGVRVEQDTSGVLHVFDGEVELSYDSPEGRQTLSVAEGKTSTLKGQRIDGAVSSFQRVDSFKNLDFYAIPRKAFQGINGKAKHTVVVPVSSNGVEADLVFDFSTDIGVFSHNNSNRLGINFKSTNQGKTDRDRFGANSINEGETLRLTVSANPTKIPKGTTISALKFGISKINMVRVAPTKGAIGYHWKSSAGNFNSELTNNAGAQEIETADGSNRFDILAANYVASFTVNESNDSDTRGLRWLTQTENLKFHFEAIVE